MPRKISDIKEEKESKKNEEVDESQWNIKRIAIFTSILALLGFLVFYFIQARTGDVLGEVDKNRGSSGPQIEIPTQEDVNEIIKDAEENISNIDANDIVSSQPQIQQAIEQLEKLTDRDNFKKVFCSAICSE